MDCAKCHGANAEGGSGPNGEEAPKTAGLRMSFADFLDQLRTPTGEMEAFPVGKLSDAGARAIYDFLRSLN
jgi:mono/diheme cytochrome c family protein